MAKEKAEQPSAEEKPKSGMKSLVLNIVVAGSAVAAGFATPYLVSGGAPGGSHQAKKDIPKDQIEYEFHEFGEVTANIDEPNLTRYLRVKISLAVPKKEKDEIIKLVEAKKILLKDWLNSYLASQNMDSIRGSAGQNRLRREIKDQFNSTLFLDGVERIHKIMFIDFNIQ